MRKMNYSGKGWFYESWRHSLAAKGISTSRHFNFVDIPDIPEDEDLDIDEEAKKLEEEKKEEDILSKGMEIYKSLGEEERSEEGAPVKYTGKMLQDKMDSLKYDMMILWTLNRKSMGPDFERKYVDVKNKFNVIKYDMTEADRSFFEDEFSRMAKQRSLQYKKMDHKIAQRIYDSFYPDKPKSVELLDLQKLFGTTTQRPDRRAYGRAVEEIVEKEKAREHFAPAIEKLIKKERVEEIKESEKLAKEIKKQKAEARVKKKKEIKEEEESLKEKQEAAIREIAKSIPGFAKRTEENDEEENMEGEEE